MSLQKIPSQDCVSFLSCHNKAPQMEQLKTTEICAVTVLEIRSPKLKRWQCWFLLEALRKNPFHASLSFWWRLAVLGIPWFVAASLQSLSPWSHGLLSVPLSVSLSKSSPHFSYKCTSYWI